MKLGGLQDTGIKKKMFQAEAVEAEKSFLLVPKSIEKNKIK